MHYLVLEIDVLKQRVSRTNGVWLLLFLLPCGSACVAAGTPDACEYFFQALSAVPHQQLSRHDGQLASLWDKQRHSGCEVRFATDSRRLAGHAVPDFQAAEGTELHRAGWRMNTAILADGPDGGLFGIGDGAVQCLVLRSQPAYLDEKTRDIVQSERLRLIVQCYRK